MRDFFCVFLNNSFAVAQNTGAQNAQTQKSNLEAQTEQNQKSSLSLLIDAVFENPTDLEINFKLLEEQTRVGDLRGAAATLDRILLLDPDSKLARVLLAEVQFNLGNLATAETALISLRDDETTPPDMLERVEKNLNAIRDAQSPWRYSASFSVARGSAENPRGASASDTILLTDIEVTNDTLDESEAYGEATLVGQVQYQLESQNPQVLKATAEMYHRDYLSYDAGDLSSLQTMVEYQRLVEPTLTFGAKFNLVAISEETYSATQGGYAEIGQTFWGRLNLNLYAETSESSNFETSARAALACGTYVHQNRFWDSATAYNGKPRSWMHHLRDAGYETTSIGKLHFHSGQIDNGFSREILPMHIVGERGWPIGLLREDPPKFDAAEELAREVGGGASSYTDYDRAITQATQDWLAEKSDDPTPFAGFISFVSPIIH